LSVNNESKVYLKGLANEIHGELSESRNEGLTIGVSRAYNEPEEINTAYKECLSILRNKVFFEKNSVVYIDELKEENSSEDYPLELEHKYIESLRFANLGKSIDILTAIIEKIILISNKEPTVFKSMIMEFIIVVARNLSEERTLEKTYPVPMKSIYSKLNSLDNMNDIKDLLSDYTKLIVDYFNERNKPGCRKIINDIKGYVNSNYFEDITLRQIANEFFMNESYLSDLFKKEAGYSFSRYLTRVRMEQAKILLKQMDLKTHEISEMVGYNNSRYFNKVFKKFTEMTPFEYRERVLNHE
jgi:two-component system response regulator YesN